MKFPCAICDQPIDIADHTPVTYWGERYAPYGYRVKPGASRTGTSVPIEPMCFKCLLPEERCSMGLTNTSIKMNKMIKKILALLSLLVPSLAAAGSGAPQRGKMLIGQASYYSKSYLGKPMANGQPYKPHAFTVACDDLPLGTLVYITYENPSNGSKRYAHATVTDRGPAQYLRNQGRIFDLSYSLFGHLAPHRLGVIKVTAQVVD